jgi:hypothetical protein
MYPQQENRPIVQTPQKKSHKKLALVLLIAPTALFILAFIFAIIAGQIDAAPTQSDLFEKTSPAKQIFNIFSFISAIVGFISWLPGLIIGIILLVKKR